MVTSAIRRGSRAPLLFAALLPALAVLAAPRGGVSQERGFQPEDRYRLVDIDDVAVSPRGGFVVFTATRAVEEENRRRSEVWLRQLRDGEPEGEPIRLSAPGRDTYAPRWAPDGTLLSFVSEREGDPDRFWFLRVGGVGGEAFHVEGVAGRPVWSPDGEWIAYRARARENEGTPGTAGGDDGADARATGAVTGAGAPERFSGRVFTGLPLRDGAGGAADGQLFAVPAEGGDPRQLTRFDGEIGEFAWGADGDWIYFSGGRFLHRPAEPGARADLWRVSRDDGEVHRITAGPGFDRAPAVSPDGERIVYLHVPAPGAQGEVHVAELGRNGAVSDQPASLTGAFDRAAGAPRWLDETTIAFVARDGGSRHLYRVSLDDGEVVQVTAGERRHESFSFSRDGSVMAYVASDPATPPELHVARGDGTVEQRATDLNGSWARERNLSPARRLTWLAEDSTEVEGWVVPPASSAEAPGDRPVVLVLPEEPHGASGHAFRPVVQTLAGAGFYVFYANPRGSEGYGREFAVANRREWGLAEKNDYLAGVETVLAEYAGAAPGRVGVVGHGYGGFLVAWLTATSDQFAAAVASAPVVDWQSWYGWSEDRGLLEREFGAAPWDERSIYRRLSPSSYLENVTTPTLLLLPDRSSWSPASQAEQWFAGLRRRNVPAEMIRYPDRFDGLSGDGDPWHGVDRLTRVRRWLEHWLVDTPLESRVSGVGSDEGSR